MDNTVEVILNGMLFRKLLEKELVDLEKKYGLRKIDMQILFYLHNAGQQNTSRDILNLNLFTKGHVSQSLTRMHMSGLVDMQHDQRDKRCVHIFLTEYACDIIDDIKKVYSDVDAAVMCGITDEERAEFTAIAAKINGNINKVLAENRG